ncbi:MAG TPA: alpha/beta hydrolase [Terracidiphilus sp.]|jgi:esterase/lipase superfamily enzyme
MRWLITNRTIQENGEFGGDLGKLSFWTLRDGGSATVAADWLPVSMEDFRDRLVKVVQDTFPSVVVNGISTPSEFQKHVCLFIHGYNNDWHAVMDRYEKVATTLFDGPDGLGECVTFDWPSKGNLLGYLSDRAEARNTADDLTNVLSELYDWLMTMQKLAVRDPENACKARTSILAHSMGNYVLEYAMNQLWTRKNRPLLVSLLQEVIMVAADVDNDLFRNGEQVSHGDGEGLSNMAYRITALYTGRDDVLGGSAGLKHFGKRRLGRSGLDRTYPLPDNVWDVDCTTILPKVNGIATHGEYFEPEATQVYALMREILQGKDRSILIHDGVVPDGPSRTQPLSAPGAIAVTAKPAPPPNTSVI